MICLRTDARNYVTQNLIQQHSLSLYRSCTRDMCKISTFSSNFQICGWIKCKLFTCFNFAVVCSVIDTQYDVIMWEEQKNDSLTSTARAHFFCSSHIMTSYCVSITEQTTAKSYLFVEYIISPIHIRDGQVV
jgi:hypothetical protein